MTFLDAVQAGFRDELEKIAGSMQGFTRAGRKPISVDRMLERESEIDSPSEELGLVEEVEEVEKEAAIPYKELALVGAGAGLYHHGRKVKRRYEIGRQVEQQNQGY